ncbi:MAG: NAD(P)/FAD-dependent oxidoreductase [Clostridia bacterium]|jgi:glycerol-3-phosphate dehydrogenase
MEGRYDVIIIGAGVIGCAVARELSRYKLSVAVLEKDSDVAGGTSGRNSGVVHAGFNNRPGSLMARYCVEGNLEFEDLCRELDVPYLRTGKLVTALDKDDLKGLEKLLDQGRKNGVPGLEIVGREDIKRMEPEVEGIAALYSPVTAVINPFLLTVALAENAWANGVRFFFRTKVSSIQRHPDHFTVRAGRRSFRSSWVINCAGLYADRIARMVGIDEYRIYPCRGEYYILDKRVSRHLKMPVYPVPKPTVGGLGVHLTPTVEGNILIGPSAEYIQSRDDYATTEPVMKQLYKEARDLLPVITEQDFIRNYSGIRPKLVGPKVGGFGDFITEDRQDVKGFINLVGIESPGLTSAMPIARRVVELLDQKERLEKRGDFEENRKGIIRFRELPEEEKKRLVEENPDYGEVVCRCETITKGEILEAIRNPLGVRTLSGIKYRARAMMGRCQGGYCLARIVEILTDEMGCRPEEIYERGPESYMFAGRVRE